MGSKTEKSDKRETCERLINVYVLGECTRVAVINNRFFNLLAGVEK
jgi:hypothetical protein